MAVTVKPAIPTTLLITPAGKFPLRNYIDLDISFDSSYANGGEPVDFNKYFQTLRMAIVEPMADYTFWYDRTNKIIHAYKAGVEVIAGGNLSTLTNISVILVGE